MKEPLQAMIFDFDGTLAHLTIDFDVMREKAYAAARRIEPAVPHHNGHPVLEWLEEAHTKISKHSVTTADAMADAAHEAIVDVEVEAAMRGTLFPWTRDLLQNLAMMGVAPAVITRNCKQAVEEVFPDIATLCPCVLTRDDVPEVKPHPDHLLRALGLLGIEPSVAIMVGDHPLDIVTGKAGGTWTGGVTSGNANHEELANEQPDFLEKDCLALYAQLHSKGMFPPAPPFEFM